MAENTILLKNVKLITPYEEIERGFLIIRDDRIFMLGTGDDYSQTAGHFQRQIDLEGFIAVPGFIDIHTHGGGGIDVTRDPEKMEELSVHKAATGVTAYLPTMWSTVGFDQLLKSLDILVQEIQHQKSGAVALGVNMEAPFLNPELGAQTGDFDVSPDERRVNAIIERGGGCVRIMNIAPELDGALDAIARLSEHGIISSLGHSCAKPELLSAAIERGANLATHLLNGTYHPLAEEKGVVPVGLNEYLMVRDDVFAEAIVDTHGAHIHPVMLTILLRCKGIDRIILITDSMFTAGLPAGDFTLQDGRTVRSDGHVNRLNNGHLTGSAMSLHRSLEAFIRHTSVSFKDALKTVTVNPARLLGLEGDMGSLQQGKKAQIAVMDDNMNIIMTIVNGVVVFSTGPLS